MGSVEVVVVQPGRELLVAFLGVDPVAGIGPFAESGLDQAFGLAVGARGVGASEAVANAELSAPVASSRCFRSFASHFVFCSGRMAQLPTTPFLDNFRVADHLPKRSTPKQLRVL